MAIYTLPNRVVLQQPGRLSGTRSTRGRPRNVPFVDCRVSETDQGVRAYPDGGVFLSLFRSPDPTLTAAKLLAEIGDRRNRYRRARPSRPTPGCPRWQEDNR